MFKKGQSKKSSENNEEVISNVSYKDESSESINPIKKEISKNTLENNNDTEVALPTKDNAAPKIKQKEIKEIVYEDRLRVREILENNIQNANAHKNYHLASELHKVTAILSDLNHIFNHLSGEAKLTISIAFKKGRVIEV